MLRCFALLIASLLLLGDVSCERGCTEGRCEAHRSKRSTSDETSWASTLIVVVAAVILAGMLVLIIIIFCKLRSSEMRTISPTQTLETECTARSPEDLEMLSQTPPTCTSPRAPARKLNYRRTQTLQEIKEELVTLTRPILAELKSYSRPPVPVHKTMMAVYMLLGEEEKKLREWHHVLALLGKTGNKSLIARITSYSSEGGSSAVRGKVRRLIQDLTSAEVQAAGRSVSCLFLWVNKVCLE